MKIRVCQDCGIEMGVPKNSGKKRCTPCNEEHVRAKARNWYKDNIRECRKRAAKRQSQRLRDDDQLRLWTRAKQRSTISGHEFDIEVSDVIVPEFCPVLGTPFEYKTYYTASIDRIDSSKGYVKGNVQVISHLANAMKNSATNEELHKFADWVKQNVPEIIE